jgi:cytosine/uracil/thiamine/allantoin permease
MVGGDFSWAMGIVVSSLVYWALAARGVRKEAEAEAEAEAEVSTLPER